jgi:hypothetical protein
LVDNSLIILSLLKILPTKYKTKAPIRLPIVLKIITSGISKLELWVINPPNVKIITDGIGENIFSKAIKKQIAK